MDHRCHGPELGCARQCHRHALCALAVRPWWAASRVYQDRAVIGAGLRGRPGIDTWLEELRSSLAQFTNSDGIGIIVGQWSIDANKSLNEPAMYGGYLQAVFAGTLLTASTMSLPRRSKPGDAAIQYPIIGSSQEPFDPASGRLTGGAHCLQAGGASTSAAPVPV